MLSDILDSCGTFSEILRLHLPCLPPEQRTRVERIAKASVPLCVRVCVCVCVCVVIDLFQIMKSLVQIENGCSTYIYVH